MLFVINSNNNHWYLLYLNISAKACYIIDSQNTTKSESANFIISFLCTINIIDNHNIDFLSADNWKKHNLTSPRFPAQQDTNNCGVFVLMNIYQILKYGTIKELFTANDVKAFRDYIFDMILHTHFENHEGMMNDIVQNTDLNYTINENQKTKIRKELENEANENKDIEDDEKQDKKKKAREKRDHKKNIFEKSFTNRSEIEKFLFNFNDILNYKSKNDASKPNNTNDDEDIEDTTTESDSDENDSVNASNKRGYNSRDEMLENVNFDLQKCIDYFVNQLRVKYLMKIRKKLDNDHPKVKVGYYDLGRLHKESNRVKRIKTKDKTMIELQNHFYEHSFYTSSAETYDRESNLDGFGTEWFQLETKFVNKWLFPRQTITNEQSNNETLRNSVMMQYPNQKKDFAQRIIKAKPKYWMKFSIEMLEVIRKIFRLDFREVVSIYCAIDSVFYHKSSNTMYGVYKHNNNEISITKLSKSFIDSNNMRRKISECKNNPNKRFSLHHGSHKSVTEEDLTSINIVAKKNMYPEIRFYQGKYDTCLQRSVASALSTIFINDKSNQVGDLILHINDIDKSMDGKDKINIIIQMMMRAYFCNERFPTNPKKRYKKRKRNEIKEKNGYFDILQNDKGLFTICQLCGSDSNSNHSVAITNEWIFDSNYKYALPLSKENLDKCCKSDIGEVCYKYCKLAYRITYMG